MLLLWYEEEVAALPLIRKFVKMFIQFQAHLFNLLDNNRNIESQSTGLLFWPNSKNIDFFFYLEEGLFLAALTEGW